MGGGTARRPARRGLPEVPLATEQNPMLWRPVSWTAERREAVSPIPGARARGETLISRRVRETGNGLCGMAVVAVADGAHPKGVSSNGPGNWNKIVIRRVFPGLRGRNREVFPEFRPNSTHKRSYTPCSEPDRSHRFLRG